MGLQVRYGQGFGSHSAVGAGSALVLAGNTFAQPGSSASMRAHDPAALHTLAGDTMGTTWSVRLANPQFAPLAPIYAAIEKVLAQVVQQMSHWQADSELCRYNAAPAASWHTLSPSFWQVLCCALDWAHASGGAFDPTLGPVVNAWGFGPRDNPQAPPAPVLPSPAALQQARARVGFGRLALRPHSRQLLQPGGAQLDLSGIAKGYGVDAVVQRLQALGWAHCVVEVGGELRACGQRPDGQPWRVAVSGQVANASAAAVDPANRGAGAPPRVVVLRDLAIATSGDHWQAFEHGGRRYSHTIDPRTGEPVRHALASVTVLHAQAMQADVLATVLTVLGPEQGLAFATQHDVAALWCERTAQGPQYVCSPAFTALAL